MRQTGADRRRGRRGTVGSGADRGRTGRCGRRAGPDRRGAGRSRPRCGRRCARRRTRRCRPPPSATASSSPTCWRTGSPRRRACRPPRSPTRSGPRRRCPRPAESVGQQQVAVMRAVAAGPAHPRDAAGHHRRRVPASPSPAWSSSGLARPAWRVWWEQAGSGEEAVALQRLQDQVSRARPGGRLRAAHRRVDQRDPGPGGPAVRGAAAGGRGGARRRRRRPGRAAAPRCRRGCRDGGRARPDRDRHLGGGPADHPPAAPAARRGEHGGLRRSCRRWSSSCVPPTGAR